MITSKPRWSFLPKPAQLAWEQANALDTMFYNIAVSLEPETNPVTIDGNDYCLVRAVRHVVHAVARQEQTWRG